MRQKYNSKQIKICNQKRQSAGQTIQKTQPKRQEPENITIVKNNEAEIRTEKQRLGISAQSNNTLKRTFASAV